MAIIMDYDLFKITKSDIERSSEVTARAFLDYPMMKHIFSERLTLENVKTVQRFLISYGVLYGEAYASSKDMEGVIIYTDFKKYNFGLYRSLRCGLLSLIKMSGNGGGEIGRRFNEFDRFTLLKHKELIKEPHQYLMLIGVDPEKQGQGFGSKLLLPLLKLAEEKGQPCYTETHGEKNLSIYKKLGFKVVSEDLVPGTDIIQYSLIKYI